MPGSRPVRQPLLQVLVGPPRAMSAGTSKQEHVGRCILPPPRFHPRDRRPCPLSASCFVHLALYLGQISPCQESKSITVPLLMNTEVVPSLFRLLTAVVNCPECRRLTSISESSVGASGCGMNEWMEGGWLRSKEGCERRRRDCKTNCEVTAVSVNRKGETRGMDVWEIQSD